MTELDNWIERATHGLSKESVEQVRREIGDHYESAREAAIAAGAASEAAERSALSALGDAKTANCQYRRVLLTASEEVRLLRSDNIESRALSTANSWVRWPVLMLSIGALALAAVLFRAGSGSFASVPLAFGIGTMFWLAGPLLPIYTPLRGRVFRVVKWLVQACTLLLAFGLAGYWLIVPILGQMSWREWKRASIRRKLAVREWPKHLYL